MKRFEYFLYTIKQYFRYEIDGTILLIDSFIFVRPFIIAQRPVALPLEGVVALSRQTPKHFRYPAKTILFMRDRSIHIQ
jgi:hypothetical protein